MVNQDKTCSNFYYHRIAKLIIGPIVWRWSHLYRTNYANLFIGTFRLQMVVRGRFYCVVNIKRVWYQAILTSVLVTCAVSNQFCCYFLSFHCVNIINSHCTKYILAIYLAQTHSWSTAPKKTEVNGRNLICRLFCLPLTHDVLDE